MLCWCPVVTIPPHPDIPFAKASGHLAPPRIARQVGKQHNQYYIIAILIIKHTACCWTRMVRSFCSYRLVTASSARLCRCTTRGCAQHACAWSMATQGRLWQPGWGGLRPFQPPPLGRSCWSWAGYTPRYCNRPMNLLATGRKSPCRQLYPRLCYDHAPAGGGWHKCRAPCPRLSGSSKIGRAQQGAEILQPLHAARNEAAPCLLAGKVCYIL